MIKEEIVAKVSAETGYSRRVVSAVIESTLSNIALAVSKNDKVQFSGFGTFRAKKRAERIGRNPQTGEIIKIPSRMSPVFTAGTGLKNIVLKNENKV